MDKRTVVNSFAQMRSIIIKDIQKLPDDEWYQAFFSVPKGKEKEYLNAAQSDADIRNALGDRRLTVHIHYNGFTHKESLDVFIDMTEAERVALIDWHNRAPGGC